MEEETIRSCRNLSPRSLFFTTGEPCHQNRLELSYITVGGVVSSETIIDALAADIQWREVLTVTVGALEELCHLKPSLMLSFMIWFTMKSNSFNVERSTRTGAVTVDHQHAPPDMHLTCHMKSNYITGANDRIFDKR